MSDSKDNPFLTYEQQITKLTEKGLTIADKNYALELLKKHSYFALISGYKNPFKAKNGMYKPHTTLSDIYSLYTFDDTLRTIVLCNILKVEKHIKSLTLGTVSKFYSFLSQSIQSFSHFVDDINTSLETLLSATKQLQRTQMYKYMGFPVNWLDIKDAPCS